MKLRQFLGIDGVDLLVHLGVTGILLFWVEQVNNGPDVIVFNSMIGIASLVTLAIRRRLALRRGQSPTGITTGEMAAERLADLEGRMADLEAAQARITELEERLDFAERLLARHPDTKSLTEGAGL
jgi:hypothetical protein